MVHQISAGLRQPEIAVIVFTLSYFSGISLGYYLSDRISLTKHGKFFPLFLYLQMFLFLFVQSASRFIYDYFTLLANADTGAIVSYLTIFIVLFIGGTSIYAVFLPAFIENSRNDLKKFYSIEIFGSIIGLLLIIPLMQLSFLALIVLYLLCYLTIMRLLQIKRSYLFVAVLISFIYVLGYGKIDRITSEYFYRSKYGNNYIKSIIDTRDTPYQRIDVADIGGGEKMLALNGRRQFAQGSHFNYSYFVAEYPSTLFEKPGVCVLGCGSMSTVGRINNKAKSFTIVDIDKEVFNVSMKYFQKYNHLSDLHNWTFVEDDAKHFIANTDRQFDLILHDIPPGKSRQTALTYTKEFFALVKTKLKNRGIFSISSLTPLNSNSNYGKRMIATLLNVFRNCFAIQYKNSVFFYGCSDNFKLPDSKVLRRLIVHPSNKNCEMLTQKNLETQVYGAEIITIGNVGDLIFE